jgi:hypothetical protein
MLYHIRGPMVAAKQTHPGKHRAVRLQRGCPNRPDAFGTSVSEIKADHLPYTFCVDRVFVLAQSLQ